MLSDGLGVERDVYHYGPARFIKGLAWGLTLSLMLWILVAWIVSGLVSQ